jgi:hypothetical protein
MPTPVDLVTDLPADFEVFGQAVDSSLADLKGGTSGQVLSKNSNTDMDFVWVTSDDANAIQNTQLTAKGALISAFSAGTPATLTVGANGTTLVADSTASTGLAYSPNAPLGGLGTIANTTLTGASSFTITGISNFSRIHLILQGASSVSAGSTILIRFNSDSGNNYGMAGSTTTSTNTIGNFFSLAQGFWPIGVLNAAADSTSGYLNLSGAFSAGLCQIQSSTIATGTSSVGYNLTGYYGSSAPITSITIASSIGNFDDGILFSRGV